jgi:hypothetical protein
MSSPVFLPPPSRDATVPAEQLSPTPRLPAPLPYTPPRCDVPVFPPIRVGRRGGRRLLRRALRRRRRTLAAGLATTAVALAVSAAAQDTPPRQSLPAPRGPATAALPRVRPEAVRDPIRIADAAVVGLLRPGERVDVLAGARIVARCAPVVAVPEHIAPAPSADAAPDGGGTTGGLVVLTVPRTTAAALSGAAALSPLAVTLC